MRESAAAPDRSGALGERIALSAPGGGEGGGEVGEDRSRAAGKAGFRENGGEVPRLTRRPEPLLLVGAMGSDGSP